MTGKTELGDRGPGLYQPLTIHRFEWSWVTVWWLVVGGRELSSEMDSAVPQRGYSLTGRVRLGVASAVSEEGDLPAAQPGSIQIAAFQSHRWLPQSCWDGVSARLSVQLPPLSYQVSWETNEVTTSCKQ